MEAVSRKANYEYICECDREKPKDEQTVFTLAHKNIAQSIYLQDRLGQLNDNGFQINIGTLNLDRIHMCLKGIDNFPDVDENGVKIGKDVELVRDQRMKKDKLPGVSWPWKLSVLEKIPEKALQELGEVIDNGGELSKEEVKN